MSSRAERYRSYPVVAVGLLAFALFAIWQLTYHWVFMELIPVRSMFASHMLSLAAETVFAALLTLYFLRVVIRQNRELRQLDHLKNVLVDSLVHDLRQPLTAVIGGLSSFTLAGELPKQATELAVIAQDGASQLLHMVNDLLDVTRLEAGAPVIETVEMPAAEFIRDGAHLLEALARERNLTLTIDTPADLPPVKGDRERLRRVVTNLVGNAVKFTESGGKIGVTATADRARGFLMVSVSDTGVGIPAEAQPRVFDKFSRVGETSVSGRTSTGLGLYFCKLTVEAHGGKMWLGSKVGEGTTFGFTVPLAREARQV